MSLETKIRELMESKKAKAQQINEAGLSSAPSEPQPMQGDSKKAEYTVIDPHTGAAVNAEDGTVKKGAAEAQAKQGDSQDAQYTQTQPQDQANGISQSNTLATGKVEPQFMQGGSKKAEYSVAGDNTSTPGTVFSKEDTETDDETITETDVAAVDGRKVDMRLEDLRKDIESVFAADTNLSEEFKTQAGAIFEAAVIARVNNEVEAITAELAEQNSINFEELKEGLVEKVDSYLNYVVEQWMKENEVAVEQGLRTEVAEDFMFGLKNLFKEHYFEVPEDRVDVLEDMSVKVDEATAKLDEAIEANIALNSKLEAIMRDRIIEQACKDLTATDAEKMSKLLEGVEFDNEELFAQKVSVVKENYFPGNAPTSPEKMLEESVQLAAENATVKEVPSQMKSYVDALSRTAKVKHLG